MTTNALLLGRLAQGLAGAGLNRVNVSIDTLDSERFKAMTRSGWLDLVWKGIEAADAAGLRPIKLNTVVVKGQNDQEVGDLAALTLDRAWQVRFLEIMPLEGVADVHDEGLVTSEETLARLVNRFGPLSRSKPTPPTRPDCGRFRGGRHDWFHLRFRNHSVPPAARSVSADGMLRLCLLRPDEADLRATPRRTDDSSNGRFRPRSLETLETQSKRKANGNRTRHVSNRRLGTRNRQPACFLPGKMHCQLAARWPPNALPSALPMRWRVGLTGARSIPASLSGIKAEFLPTSVHRPSNGVIQSASGISAARDMAA